MASLDDGCALIRVKARFPHEVLVEANFCASEAKRSVISEADVELAIASRIGRALQFLKLLQDLACLTCIMTVALQLSL